MKTPAFRLPAFLVRPLYNLLFPFVFLLLLPAYVRRMVRRGNYRRDFAQRLGFYSSEVRARLASGPSRIWLQAVSVGEVLTALKLVDALRTLHPDLPLILSTTTTTGHQLARERAGRGVEVIYTPIDLAGAVRRAFDVMCPARVVVVDGGLWPNLLWEARRRNVPTAWVNARLSPRSERRFRRFRPLVAPMFGLLDLVCVSEPGDSLRWQQLGIPVERLHRTGSIKFDDQPTKLPVSNVVETPHEFLQTLGFERDTPVLLAGSTHPGEEQILAQVFTRLRQRFRTLRLLVAPRHVERAGEVRAELEKLDLTVISRTEALAAVRDHRRITERGDVLLLDTTGELAAWYPTATIVFIGKSLAATGGQNPAEAIAAGRPVVFGPHMENFRELVDQLLGSRGAVQIQDEAGLEAECARLLADPAARSRLAENGRRQLAVHHGAALRTAELLLDDANFSTCQSE